MTTTDERHRHPHLRPNKIRWGGWIGVGLVAFLALWTPSDDGPTLCPFALLTGIACPGCGMTRAIAWLARGDFTTSVAYHPLAPFVAVTGVGLAAWWIGSRRFGWKLPPLRLVNAVLVTFGVLLIATWVVRISAGTLPPV
ncbi:MAG TPA: DUF2752 domain-containing protein [Acidimicrobiia bacterium]